MPLDRALAIVRFFFGGEDCFFFMLLLWLYVSNLQILAEETTAAFLDSVLALDSILCWSSNHGSQMESSSDNCGYSWTGSVTEV